MKTIKLIDLLNKIANGEEVPKKIKWGIFTLEWDEVGYHDYKFVDIKTHLLFNGFASSCLNNEVEIIEENKEKTKKDEIDKIVYGVDIDGDAFIYANNMNNFLDGPDVIIVDKINEIIDYLESK